MPLVDAAPVLGLGSVRSGLIEQAPKQMVMRSQLEAAEAIEMDMSIIESSHLYLSVSLCRKSCDCICFATERPLFYARKAATHKEV